MCSPARYTITTNRIFIGRNRASCSTRRGVRESVSPTHWLVHIALEVTVAGEGAGCIDRLGNSLYYKPDQNILCEQVICPAEKKNSLVHITVLPRKLFVGKCMYVIATQYHEILCENVIVHDFAALIKAHASTISLGNAIRKQFRENLLS